jgi:hypothetical protein
MWRPIAGLTRRAALALAMLGAGILPAASQSSRPQPVPTPFDEDGYQVTATVTKQECLVVSAIDLADMVAKTSDLQSKGIIRPDVDAAHVKAHGWTTAAAFGLKVEPLFVVTVFKNSPEIDKCHFGLAIIGFDDKPQIAYTFSMSRAEYDKVDWSNFGSSDLPNVVQDFTVGTVTAEHMNAESKVTN